MIIVIIIILSLTTVAFFWFFHNSKNKNAQDKQANEQRKEFKIQQAETPHSKKLSNKIKVSFPEPNEKVGGTIYITGIAEGGWYFEGDFPVKLVDKDGKILASAPASAQGEWMRESFVPFVAEIRHPVSKITEAKIILEKDNPSDIRELDESFEIPVTLEPKKTSVKLFFSNKYTYDAGTVCGTVFPISRPGFETMAIGHASLEELFKGPNELEKSMDYFTAIPPGVKIQKLSITGGTARVDLSKEILNMKTGATCERLVIKEQISQTLKQFSSVKNVIITVDEKESALDAIKEYEL